MTYPEAVEYLLSLLGDIRVANFGLDRMNKLLARLGNPQSRFQVVHVAGTNAKGSTAAMIEAGLRADHRTVGLYTSPHLVRFNERIRVHGLDIGDDSFARAVDEVRVANDALASNGQEKHPTLFESVTAAAFCAFRAAKVEWAVVEVGLGGRLDATNVVEPALAVITAIGLDHESFLGKGLEVIAGEKAGILKPGAKAVFAPQQPSAGAVLEQRACELGVAFTQVGLDWKAQEITESTGFYRFQARGPAGQCIPVELPLAGEHQIENALTAVAALDLLGVESDVIRRGIGETRWAGRLQSLGGKPEVLLDAAHNPLGAQVLARFLEKHHGLRRIHLIYGSSRDKAVDEVAGLLFPCAHRVILTSSQVSRSLSPRALRDIVDHHHERIEIAATLEEALRLARAQPAEEDLIVIAGSIFLIGEAL